MFEGMQIFSIGSYSGFGNPMFTYDSFDIALKTVLNGVYDLQRREDNYYWQWSFYLF